MPFAPLYFELVVSIINASFKLQNTVGGTSLVDFRPGFFRGGSTQVLLNAPFEMISASASPDAAGKGEMLFTESDDKGRGARCGLMIRSGDVARDIIEEMVDRGKSCTLIV